MWEVDLQSAGHLSFLDASEQVGVVPSTACGVRSRAGDGGLLSMQSELQRVSASAAAYIA
jgi:hypothetical protein